MRTETVVARVVARLELAGAVAATDCDGNHGGTGTRAVSQSSESLSCIIAGLSSEEPRIIASPTKGLA